MTLFLFVSNFELSKHVSVFVPLWLNDYNKLSIFRPRFHDQLSGKNKLYWLWERLPAAIILFRGWKPLPQWIFYGNLDSPDKRLILFVFKNPMSNLE
jgi:hypothetical protein